MPEGRHVLNFENGSAGMSLSAYWQWVVRGVFLMIVVMAGSGGQTRGPAGLNSCPIDRQAMSSQTQ